MHSKPKVISKIYELIETIEQELQQVKELLNQVTSEESTQDEIVIKAEFIEEARKPEAKPTKSSGTKESIKGYQRQSSLKPGGELRIGQSRKNRERRKRIRRKT
jgi:cell division septum initiation protein DivIVA